ncbi:MAG TPA: hypothetical protein ENH82_17740 [bacterium]|nr:hypothetical protein [bacterium]
MQAEYPDGVFGEVEDFDAERMAELLKDADKVTVFKKGTPAHRMAERNYSEMSKNQKKRARKKQKRGSFYLL